MATHSTSQLIKRPHKAQLVLTSKVFTERRQPRSEVELGLLEPAQDTGAALAVLGEATDVLDRLKVLHFICDGTLLGAIRDDGFIRGDNDVDLRVDRVAMGDDLVQALRDAGFSELRSSRINGHLANLTVHKDRIVLDLYGTDFSNSNATFHVAQYPRCYVSYKVPFDGAELRRWQGQQVWMPKHPEAELVACYGPRWQLPIPKWDHVFSHQGVYRCTGRFRELVFCAFNLEECQRSLNGGDHAADGWSARELAGAARGLIGMRPGVPEI